MLRRVSRQGASFLGAAGRRLEARLPVLLPGPLRRLDSAVAASLIAVSWGSIAGVPDSADLMELRSFTHGFRTLEAALPVLATATRQRLGVALRSGQVSFKEAALLVAVVFQLRPAGELVALFQAGGRAALIQILREIVGRLLDERDSADGFDRAP
jgi:tRNA(Met) cytidine acetyltransferase